MTDKEKIHIDDTVISMEKDKKRVSGDFTLCFRCESHTDFILCDGIGSGIRADIAARMSATRISGLLKCGMSVRKTARRLSEFMHGIKSKDIPYSAFLIIRILNDGNCIAAGYEIPEPILLYGDSAKKVEPRYYTYRGEVLYEASFMLEQGHSVLICSDGITQAGMGRGFPEGWTSAGLGKWLDSKVRDGVGHGDVAKAAFERAVEISGGAVDDMTIALLKCRCQSVINVMTGPPSDKLLDREFIRNFISSNGKKIICGSSTMDMVSRITGRSVCMKGGNSMTMPPQYMMEGIDFAAEGAVTLNQIYNILGEDSSNFDQESIVTAICRELQSADLIRIFLGDALNEGYGSIVFKQTGILPRATIVPLIVEKLFDLGKTVSIINP